MAAAATCRWAAAQTSTRLAAAPASTRCSVIPRRQPSIPRCCPVRRPDSRCRCSAPTRATRRPASWCGLPTTLGQALCTRCGERGVGVGASWCGRQAHWGGRRAAGMGDVRKRLVYAQRLLGPAARQGRWASAGPLHALHPSFSIWPPHYHPLPLPLPRPWRPPSGAGAHQGG